MTAPWWVWIGGVLGAAAVTVALMAVSRIGSSLLSVSVIAALAIDHFGWFGLSPRPITPARLGAVVLMF